MWEVFFVIVLAVAALILRLPIERPWSSFLSISVLFLVVMLPKSLRERFVQRSDVVSAPVDAQISSLNVYQRMALLPQYAVESIGTGLDSLIAAMKKGNDMVLEKPAAKVTRLDETQFACPNPREPLCRGRFLDKIAFAELKNQLVDVRDFFAYFDSSTVSGRKEALKTILGSVV